MTGNHSSPTKGIPESKLWLDGIISAVEFAALPVPMPVVSAVQIRLQLLNHGIDGEDVVAAINASGLADIDRRRALAYWEYSSRYERDNPLIAQIGAALGFTPEQIDAEFHAAEWL